MLMCVCVRERMCVCVRVSERKSACVLWGRESVKENVSVDLC